MAGKSSVWGSYNLGKFAQRKYQQVFFIHVYTGLLTAPSYSPFKVKPAEMVPPGKLEEIAAIWTATCEVCRSLL